MKRLVVLVLAVLLVFGCCSGLAEKEPDFSQMTAEEWFNYEFYMDYSQIWSDIPCYDLQYVRDNLVDAHWQTYFAIANEDLSEEEKLEAVQHLHDTRIATPMISDPEESRIYLWPKGHVPTVTEYTENPDYTYKDSPEFEPYMYALLVDEGVEPKGAVLLCPGGGRQYRSSIEEGIEVAQALNARGYQCFIVNYRILPYTIDESALDVARAVRYVRAHAEEYGIDSNQIAAAGFSAGGSTITATINGYCGDVNASALVEGYVPDELDQVSADINCYLSIYGNYNPEDIQYASFPPIFFAIGGEDGWESCSTCFDAARDAGLKAELHIFATAPHAFGAGRHADGTYYENAATWPSLADVFMQDVYTAD